SNAQVTVVSSPAGVSSTVAAVNGVATFSDLIFNAKGNYTLTANSSGLFPAFSNAFSIAGPLPSLLVDTPAPGAVVTSGTIVVSGWALGNSTPISAVK